jgi:hypothetical protein
MLIFQSLTSLLSMVKWYACNTHCSIIFTVIVIKEYELPDPFIEDASITEQQQLVTAMNGTIHSELSDTTNYSLVLDPDLHRDNPVEAKHRRLVRSHRSGPLDRDLKPNPKIRDELNVNNRKYNVMI